MKAKLRLTSEEINDKLQYTQIIMMLGEEDLNRWTKFQMTDNDQKDPKKVFQEFKKYLNT